MNAAPPIIPNFFILGAQKAGTTYLWTHLARHPQIFLSTPKELNFFDQHPTPQRFAQVYLPHFEAAQGYRWVGEATPTYLWHADPRAPWAPPLGERPPDVAREVVAYCGSAIRCIVSLRNPILRAVSAFYHHFRKGRIPREAGLLASGAQRGIIDMGFYHRHLSHWWGYIPPEQWLILDFHTAIAGGSGSGLAAVWRFLELAPLPTDPVNLHHPTHKGLELHVVRDVLRPVVAHAAPGIPLAELQELGRLYEADIRQLETALGWDLAAWRAEPTIAALRAYRSPAARPILRVKRTLKRIVKRG